MGQHEVFERLEAEYDAFDRTLRSLDDDGWSHHTRCEAWDVRDVICHLWLQAAAAAAFAADEEPPFESFPDPADLDAWVDEQVQAHKDVPGPEVWRRYREARTRAVTRLRARPEDQRVPWTILEMRPSMLGTVLAMETWTHHRDVREPLGLPAESTPSVQDVAFLVSRTLPWAFGYAGEEPRPVRFELQGPDGEVLTYGPENADGVVRGDLEEFCNVAVQRLPLSDAETLTAEGDAAEVALRVMRPFA
ncbi:MAG: maleylpyruvate isomerase family mycothiol-dependent enzyme [Nitriliruptorales bacterium]|nr:maleylpyruvate isomerase family mycothiol-dependent enzyme [Nitriliruptorales bacterium]